MVDQSLIQISHSIPTLNFSQASYLIEWVHRQQNHPRNIQSFNDFIGYSSFSRGTATTQTCNNMITSFNHSGLVFKLKSTIKPNREQTEPVLKVSYLSDIFLFSMNSVCFQLLVPITKASLNWAPCSLYQGGLPAV